MAVKTERELYLYWTEYADIDYFLCKVFGDYIGDIIHAFRNPRVGALHFLNRGFV